jgi:uncharacterized protein (TIGR03083 family)
MIGRDSELTLLDREIAAFGDLADGDLTVPVPTCPGWTMADLVDHMAGTYWWFRAWASLDGAGDRVRFRDAPVRPVEVSPADWLATQATETRTFFESADPDRPAPTFFGPRTVGWWIRRAVLELAVHLTDAQCARGLAVLPPPVAVAIAGIDESLRDFLPAQVRSAPGGLAGTIHLHCTDAEGEWLVRLTTGAGGGTVAEVTAEHAKGDVAARGTAGDLYLTLWGRPGLDRLEVFGDRDLLDRFLAQLRT